MTMAEKTSFMDIGYQKVDVNGNWRLSELFSALTDVATTHATELKLWDSNMFGTYGWIVSKMRIQILKPIRYEQKIAIKTWPGQGTRVIFPRYYEIRNEADQVCVQAVGQWTLLDLVHRRITSPQRVGLTFPEELNLNVPLMIETDFSEMEDYQLIDQRQVKYSDIDTNGHLNNARYVELVLDILDYDRFKKDYIADFSIYFKKETAPGVILNLELKEDGDRFWVRGTHADQIHFLVEGQWQPH